jgi:hypothetical protein
LPRKAGRPARVTTILPSVAQILLRCPACDALLVFVSSTEGGVQPIEHWDRYECGQCHGAFEYRRRTRHIRRVM